MKKLTSVKTSDKPLLMSDEAMHALAASATRDALVEAAKLDLEVTGYVGETYTRMRARDLIKAMDAATQRHAVA